MIRRMAAVVCWTQRNATALRSLRNCRFRTGDSNSEMYARSWLEKIRETNSGGHFSTGPSWSGSHSSGTADSCRDFESALTHTSISTRRTTAPARALEVPITSPLPSPDSRVLLAVSGSWLRQSFGIALRGALPFLAQDLEHRTRDGPPKGPEPRDRSRD